LQRILGARYHVVVGNPPYITPKDAALNQKYRERFGACHRQYSLAVPFMERFFDLGIAPEVGGTTPAGFVGVITANSFMKREFGKKLIEEFIPRWDLTHVVDTSGAYIPGHGTPTVILFARHRRPLASTIRAVMGIRGEPQTPDDPAKGLVWSAIVSQIDQPGSQSAFVSVGDVPRERFQSHPWSIGGGGVADVKSAIERSAPTSLGALVIAIGRVTHTGCDEAYFASPGTWSRFRIRRKHVIPLVEGDCIRDWHLAPEIEAIFPYDSHLSAALHPEDRVLQHLWIWRQFLTRRREPNGTHAEIGLTWYEWSRFQRERFRVPLSIAFAFVATHNHFVLDRGGKVFKQSAPVIKLPADATEDDHLGLLGLLNSSTGCFWMKQVFHCKGAQGINEGGKEEKWEQFYEFDGTKIQQFPVPAAQPVDLARDLDEEAATMAALTPAAAVERAVPSTASLLAAYKGWSEARECLVALQEELDWRCYELYGLLTKNFNYIGGDTLRVKPGERALEIVLARRMAAGEIETKWFERHGSTSITEIPDRWPEDYRQLMQRRIEVIESNPDIALIEQPEYKRRWNTEPWEEQQERALRGWLLDRLEDPRHWPGVKLTSCAKLADRVRSDTEFMQVAELYRGETGFDVTRLVTELVEAEGVPFLPVLRYTESGLRKRAAWEECWALQRSEDAGEAAGEITVPPKYVSGDFRKQDWWRLRGKLDVPKERFILYPHAERAADPTPVLGWAGWDALQQATALAEYYLAMKDIEAWPPARLAPLLAGLVELLPWLRQWHNDLDPAMGVGTGDYYAQFTAEEARSLGLTLAVLGNWKPAPTGPRHRPRRGARR